MNGVSNDVYIITLDTRLGAILGQEQQQLNTEYQVNGVSVPPAFLPLPCSPLQVLYLLGLHLIFYL